MMSEGWVHTLLYVSSFRKEAVQILLSGKEMINDMISIDLVIRYD